jgi:predicted nucleotidyltransferase component of viral defense system
MGEFVKLSHTHKVKLFDSVATKMRVSSVAIEKDWWVTAVLRALFSLPYADNLSFKGGTSLSKCWNLIARFSEDIDIAVSREYLGFSGALSKTQISDKLRRAACSFTRERLQYDLAKQLETHGVRANDFFVKVNITSVSTTDPEIIEVEYRSLYDGNTYIKRKVLVEVSGRSMNEPVQNVKLQSIINEALVNASFAEAPFMVQAVVPQRTFIEKICLLHEEFAKSQELIRTERMSRHLYDLVKMMDTPIAKEALSDKQLYHAVVAHRRIFMGLKDFDYSTLFPKTIKLLPPAHLINQWKSDYETMQDTMIYSDSLPFNKLIDKIRQLNEEINCMDW